MLTKKLKNEVQKNVLINTVEDFGQNAASAKWRNAVQNKTHKSSQVKSSQDNKKKSELKA